MQRDGKLVRVPVTVGLNNDAFAEIKAGDLKVGDQVVVSAVVAGASGRAASATPPSLRGV